MSEDRRWEPVDRSQAWAEWAIAFADEYQRVTGRDYHEVPIETLARFFIDTRFPADAVRDYLRTLNAAGQ